MKICILIIFLLIFCKGESKQEIESKNENKPETKMAEVENFSSESKSDSYEKYYITTIDGLFLREGSSTKTGKIILIPYNEEIEVSFSEKVPDTINNDNGNWIKAKYKENEGWVFDKFISKNFISDCNIFTNENFPKKFTNGCVGQCPKGTEDGTNLRVLFLSSSGEADIMVDVSHQFNKKVSFGKWKKIDNKIVINGEIEYNTMDQCISACKDTDITCKECESKIKNEIGKKETKLELNYELYIDGNNISQLRLMSIKDKKPIKGKNNAEILIEEDWKKFVNEGYQVCIIPKLRVN